VSKNHLLLTIFAALSLGPLWAQSGGSVRGTIVDPSGAAIKAATVEIENPVSHYVRATLTDAQGGFVFTNLPFNNYHVTASAAGFQVVSVDVNVRSSVPVTLDTLALPLAAAVTAVTVSESAGDLVETDPTTHTDLDRQLFDKLPMESASSSLSSVVTLASPGVTADSNGLFHGLGDHAQNSFSLDGQPITDQQSKVFSNEIPTDAVQSMEVIEGAPPAEYGDKTSLVIVVTTRSGLGVTQPHGDVTASYGSFGTGNGAFDLAYGANNWGNFISANGMDTGRFLDTPEFQIFHDHGNEQNVFDRLDLKPTQNDNITINLGFTRSWFQTPNSYDSQTAGAWSGLVVNNGGLGPNGLPVGPTDQRSQIQTINFAPSWNRVLSSSSVFTLGAFFRRDAYNYYPSTDPFADLVPDLQRQTVSQARTLANIGGRTSLSYVKGIHNVKAGLTYQDTLLTENDGFGIVDPTFNSACLSANGSPYTGFAINNPLNCTGALAPNPGFVPLLACYDLTRPGLLPSSFGCPNANPATYLYHGHADIREISMYIQDAITLGNWTFNLGLRGDVYDGITSANQVEPRLGIAYNFKPTGTVFRVSYARTLETPFNENLVLASEGCTDPVINQMQALTQGYPCITSPITPGWRNEFHAGLEQAFGKYFVLDGEYIWKYTHGAYDFSILGNTPITYPIEWARSKIPGFAIRGSMPNFHGLSAFVVMSHVAARFFLPQVAGIGETPLGAAQSGVFRIDHDEAFNETTHIQYQPFKNGPWYSFNWRYDSGMVAGAVPFALTPGGIVDASYLTPDQQFEAGLFCGSVHATPTTPISPSSSCPGNLFGSNLVRVPAPGTENPDHNPPRIAPRNLFDMAIGDDNLFHGDRYKWSARFEAVNITNEYALYNFLSTFSGTHYVTPRALTATLGFHF
jgi:hypothetical protein